MNTQTISPVSCLHDYDPNLCYKCEKNPRPFVVMPDGEEIRAAYCAMCANSPDLQRAIAKERM